MNWIRRNKWTLAGTLAGGLGGFLYYHFVGCASGTCMITSRPLNSTLYGMLMGALLFSSFSGVSNAKNKKE